MLRKRFISSFIIEIQIEIKAFGLLQDINYERQPTAGVASLWYTVQSDLLIWWIFRSIAVPA